MTVKALQDGYKYAPQQLGRVLVLGLGKSGQAALDYLIRLRDTYGRVEQLCVMAGEGFDASNPLVKKYGASGVEVVCGTQSVSASFDLGIASPGIPEWSELYVTAKDACTELIGEVEFAWRESSTDSVWVAVTGTNGKTTVTSLINHLLKTAGFNSNAVGNIGEPCLQAVESGTTHVYVAEVSSYQLASTIRFAPQVAVVLNITPDHLHWHGSFEKYRDAKFKILTNLEQSKGVAVLDCTNDVVRNYVKEQRLSAHAQSCCFSAYVPVGTKRGIEGDMRQSCGSKNAAYLSKDGELCIACNGEETSFLSAEKLRIPGAHNALNALMAAVAAHVLGADQDSISEGLATFSPLTHRIEPCGEVDGVRFFNDSKATNVDATLKALEAFPHTKPLVLLGGDDKGTSLDQLVRTCFEHARVVVCYGAAGERFAQSFECATKTCPSDFKVMRSAKLKDAFEVALAEARAGEIVLLSPACASFDEFSCFEERGDTFKRYVLEASLAVSLEGSDESADAAKDAFRPLNAQDADVLNASS